MNRFTLKHLRWVLWLWLLLVEVSGEDGATSKSEKRLVIKQESGPKGDSLVRSFVSTRTSRAFSSTSSFDDGWRTDKPPDERQSTIRLRNDTVDLSKNTVPVLKYPGPTESSLKEKYRRTTGSPETTPLKKNLKLKRNMTRSRPSDLTTLLVYNALTPGRYPSTTQVAESMPPTAWALASLKGPAPPPNVKPFVSWSTRLSRATTPSPITEVTELVTEMGTTNQQDIISGFDTTAPGNEEIDTTALSNEGTSPIPIVEVATLPITTQKSAEVTALKPEENTISVPPLASLKNRTFEQETGDIIPDYESHKKVLIEPTLRKNDSFLLPDEEHQHSLTTNESRNNMTPFILTTKPTAKLNKTFRPEDNLKVTEENNDASLKVNYDSLNKTDQEVDPSINAINVKKRDDQISTSTVISAVNSTVTIHVTSPISTTSRNSNLTNLIDVDQKLSVNEFEYGKNLPLSVETTTVPLTSYPPPSPQIADHDPLFNEANQTSNDIQVIAKSSKVTPMASDNVSMETPSTLKSNEIKPELVSTNSVKNANITEYPTDSFHNYVQEFSETTQSNDILVQDQIKPVNKTLIQHISESSLDNQKHLTSTVSVLSIKPTSYPATLLVANKTITSYVAMTEVTPVNDTAISNVTIPMNETFTNDMTTLPPITTTPLPITTIIPNTEPITVSSFSSTPLSISDSSSTTLPITFPTTIRTTSSFPMNITSTNTNITQNNMTNNTNMITSSTTTTTAPVLITTQSNKLRDEDFVTELLSETNTTNFESDSKSSIKNDTSFGFRDSEDGEDDDTLSYNHTDISDRKIPSDTISNNDNEDDSDDLLETTVSGNISTAAVNSSKETTTPVPVTNLSSPKPTFSEEATRIDEERTNIDDDTIYDTAGIMPIYIRLVIQATYHELCKNKDPLKDSIVKVFKNYAERTINRRQVMITNLGINDCSTFREEMEPRLIPVHIMLTNTQGQYDKSLNDLFISLARRKNLDFKYPISQVEKVQQDLFPETETQISGTMVAAIVISSIAAVCLFALTILLVIMRKRQTGFNYGQRCTPVSLDDYSLDNISVYNSVRRKAIRASKRSYGNPAFDDADAISNPVNFAGLANMSSDKSKTDEEYSSLPQVVVKPDELPPGAEIKNRYANVIPIPETRVQLRASTPENQFINANFVKGAKGADKFYIACQAPIQNTIEDFWQMIWDEQSRLIIMLTALTENGVEKCADYLPPSEVLDCHRVFGDLQVTLKKREAREKYVISSLQLKNLETNLWREVTHMWYAGWPPMGVPPEPSSVIAFLIEARSYSKSSPIVVHCSPGTGRTGTVIAIDIAIRDFEAGRSVDIPKTVVQVRRGRAGAVQTKDQYSFIYKVLHLYATKLTGGGLDSI